MCSSFIQISIPRSIEVLLNLMPSLHISVPIRHIGRTKPLHCEQFNPPLHSLRCRRLSRCVQFVRAGIHREYTRICVRPVNCRLLIIRIRQGCECCRAKRRTMILRGIRWMSNIQLTPKRQSSSAYVWNGSKSLGTRGRESRWNRLWLSEWRRLIVEIQVVSRLLEMHY